eukprot:m.147691 g.147691  ORF g.147691 m.147691 type:complete len:1300 (-) comp30554_c0_seq1:33-3932(-)
MKFKRKQLKTKAPVKIKTNSASSNPTGNKHREQAKQFSIGVQKAKSAKVGKWRAKKRAGVKAAKGVLTKKGGLVNLTQEALMVHNDNGLEDVIAKMVPAVTGNTTLESNGEDIFAPVRQKWNSLQESDKEACAVLAAITESIKEKGAKESPTAYWAALMSTLEVASANGAEDEKAASAVLYLLLLVFPHVPVGVCRKQFSQASQVIVGVITKFAMEGSQSLIKSSLGCLASLLSAQELAVWQASSTSQVFRPLLAFAVDTRPKVRKAAQSSIESLVKSLAQQSSTHPVIKDTAAFCISRLKKEEVAMYVLNLLVSVFPTFDAEAGQEISVRLFQFLGKGERHMKDKCAEIFQAAFSATDVNLSTKLLDQVTEELFQHEPQSTDVVAKKSWNDLMVAAHKSLAKRDVTKSMRSVIRLCQALILSYETDTTALVEHATQTLLVVIGDIVKPFVESKESEMKSGQAILSQLFAAFETALRYRYQKNYTEILKVISALFGAVGAKTYPHGSPMTKSILQMRSTKDIDCDLSIESTIGAAVKAMGPAQFLQISPLDLISAAPKDDFSTAWILPLLKSSISHTKLGYFTSNILPIAANLKAHGQTAETNGKDLVASTYQTLYKQIWDLLPAFCNHATDVSTSFVGLARTLGTVLAGEPTICPIICQALITLLRSADESPGDKLALAAFGKNFLPILFNVFCGEDAPDANKAKSLLAIEAYVPITDPRLTASMLTKVFAKLQEASTVLQQNPDDNTKATFQIAQQNMLDLCLALSSCVDDPSTLFDVATPLLTDPNVALQKKAYKCLSLVCSSKRPAYVAFVKEKQDDLTTLTTEAMAMTASASKQQRMVFISSLITALEGPKLREFVPEIIAEVILSCKEVNERSRQSAFECLIEIGKAIHAVELAPNPAITIKDYFSIVVAGLAGQTPHMMSATIVALSRLIYQFRSEMEDSQIQQVFEGITMLLQSRAREVVKSALGFIKVALGVMPTSDFELHLKGLVLGLVHWSGPAFRMKTRMIFERLIRKFGYEAIEAVTPEEHHKLLSNIRKRKEREKKKDKKRPEDKDADAMETTDTHVHKPSYEELLYDSDDGTDADAEMEEEDVVRKGQKKRKGKTSGTYIQEDDDDDDAIDLLDTTSGRIKGAKPKASRKRTGDVSESFKIGDDGRWIVNDDEEMKTEDTAPAPKESAGVMSTDAWSERMSARAGKKRAIQKRNDDMPDEDDDVESAAAKALKNRYPGQEYRAKRAGGDVKVKGKQNPYAYIPFDTTQLNRRKRSKAVGEFKGLMSAAKKGSAMGKKKRVGGRR